jgi:hypothetical protein
LNSLTRLSLVDRADAELSIVAQCYLLKLARSSPYCHPAAVRRGRSLADAPDRRVVSGDAVPTVLAAWWRCGGGMVG